MKLSRILGNKRIYYAIDGKCISRDALNEFCKKYFSSEGLNALWRKLTKDGECIIDLDITVDFNEQSIIESKNAELQEKCEVIAALEKKLMQAKIKAAKYDCLMSAMKTA